MIYYNPTTHDYYYSGHAMTKRNNDGSVFSGIPTAQQLEDWGYEEYAAPEPAEPTVEELARQRMSEIQMELQSMDYLTSKYIDGEDMTQYGDWQAQRRALRAEYNQLETQLQEGGVGHE